MKNWLDFKKEVLKDPKVKKEYDRLVPYYEAISNRIKKRIKKDQKKNS